MMQDSRLAPVRVCVLGAGVIGLSTALRVAEDSKAWTRQLGRDIRVSLAADRFSPNTTSDGSGGFWEPFKLGDTPISLIRKWGGATWDYMEQLACSPDLAAVVGAQFVSGYSLTDEDTQAEPFYKDMVLGFRRLTDRELQQFPIARAGYFFTSLELNVKLYLPWLMQRFLQAGGRVEHQTVDSLQQVADTHDVVVNCCGPRAGLLVSDSSALPIRGQVRRVRAPWIKHFYMYESSKGTVSYVLPLGDEVIVGGVAQEGQWSEQVDIADSIDIWNRATKCFGFLQKAVLVSEWAGLRPGRDSVRLQEDTCTNSCGKTIPVIHNYGHGGAGVTLHWGCAIDSSALVHKVLVSNTHNSRL